MLLTLSGLKTPFTLLKIIKDLKKLQFMSNISINITELEFKTAVSMESALDPPPHPPIKALLWSHCVSRPQDTPHFQVPAILILAAELTPVVSIPK